MSAALEIAAAAARLVVDEGLEYAAAKRRAARELQRRGARQTEWPSNEQVEDAVREHIELFCAQQQPAELRALRGVARLWMQRLARFRPHLAGAVWRGTATRLCAVHLDLYCDDLKAAEFTLVDAGERYDTASVEGPAGALSVLTLTTSCRELGEPVTVHLTVRDLDEQRNALKPDARGRSWRGDLAALERLLQDGAA